MLSVLDTIVKMMYVSYRWTVLPILSPKGEILYFVTRYYAFLFSNIK